VIEKTAKSKEVSNYIREYLEDHPFRNEVTLQEMSREPWLYDSDLTDEERMVWKIKDKCHVC